MDISIVILFLSSFVTNATPYPDDTQPYNTKWDDNTFINSFNDPMDMLKFKENSRNFDKMENPTMDSYVHAYNLQQAEYKNEDENNSTSKEKRTKRSTPPELIKFELSDAREPDEATKELLRRHREQRNMQSNKEKTETNAGPKATSSPKQRSDVVDDQEIHESRMLKVVHPVPKNHKSVYAPEKLPHEVEKIIGIVMQNKGLYKDKVAFRYGAPLTVGKLNYGERMPKYYDSSFNSYIVPPPQKQAPSTETFGPSAGKPKLEQSQSQYVAAYFPLSDDKFKEATSHSGYVQASASDYHTVNKVVRIPVPEKISYVYKDAPLNTEPIAYNHVQQNDVSPPVLYADPISYKHTSSMKDSHSELAEPIPYKHASGSEVVHNEVPMQIVSYVPQSDLQSVSHQHGEIQLQYAQLGDYEKQIIDEHKLFQHDQENVAQHEQKVQEDGSNYNALSALVGKEPNDQLQGLKFLLTKEIVQQEQQTHQEQSQQQKRPQDNTSPILFHPVKGVGMVASNGQNAAKYPQFFGVTNAPSGFVPKDYTPITESPEEVTQAPVKFEYDQHNFVHITPTPPTSYNHVRTNKVLPNYDAHSHDDNGLQYASAYAFGYRVRDFHTGNDFGHKQKQDVDGITRGEYHILLPDGRVQNVRYHADDSGYHADVSYQTTH